MPTIRHTTTLATDDATPAGDTLQTTAKVVAASLVAGLTSAVALVAGPFAGGGEATTTGAILRGFAIGWASNWPAPKPNWRTRSRSCLISRDGRRWPSACCRTISPE